MATLINGDGNAAVYAQQDADWFQAIMGSDKSLILDVGLKMAYEIEDANTIAVKNGVILTKEGRRIQIDVGSIDEFTIPTGEQGVTNYYIIGFHLYTDGSSKQLCETFVEKMNNATDTIPEATFRGGATEVYVSLYRVTQIGFAIDSASLLLEYGSGIGAINASLTEKVTQKEGNISVEGSTISSTALDWVTWDETNGRMILHKKGTGADAGFPFSGGDFRYGFITNIYVGAASNTLFITPSHFEILPITNNYYSRFTIYEDDDFKLEHYGVFNGAQYYNLTAKKTIQYTVNARGNRNNNDGQMEFGGYDISSLTFATLAAGQTTGDVEMSWLYNEIWIK